MKSFVKLLALGATLLGAGAAHAADPMVVTLAPGFTFEEYSGTGTIGTGGIDVDNTLFFVDELAVDGLKSWLLFADPTGRAQVSGLLQFDQPIVAVYVKRADIAATTPVYGLPSLSYGSPFFSGLEGLDQIGWTVGGTTLSIDWRLNGRGDEIRVITAAQPVPEPAPFMLLAGGLAMLGWLKRRRTPR